MSLFDDDRPKKPQTHEIGSDLSLLSVDEILSRVAILENEIERLKAEAAAKAKGRSAAEDLFRS